MSYSIENLLFFAQAGSSGTGTDAPSVTGAPETEAPSAVTAKTSEKSTTATTQQPDNSDASAKPAEPVNSPLSMIIMVTAFLVLMWVMFVLPKRSQNKQMTKMIDSLKKNDKVMTTSGIIGIVSSVDREQQQVVLKVDETTGTKLRFSVGAIYHVFEPNSAKDDNSDKK